MSDTCPKEYTPSTEEVRDAYNVGVDPEFYGAEFDRWHQAELRRAKTISAEQVEAAAEAVWSESDWTVTPRLPWEEWAKDSPIPADRLRHDARAAFRAAGLLIEGEG